MTQKRARGPDLVVRSLTNPPESVYLEEGRAVAASALTVGDGIELKRDYDNTVDRNAVLVVRGFDEIGYLPRHLAQVLAPELDAGLGTRAVVVAVEPTLDRPRVEIRIDVADEARASAN